LKEWEKKRRDTQCPNNISTVINVRNKNSHNLHGSGIEQSRENYIYWWVCTSVHIRINTTLSQVQNVVTNNYHTINQIQNTKYLFREILP
jgi:hypothetical protein